jgi:hypothetical protein
LGLQVKSCWTAVEGAASPIFCLTGKLRYAHTPRMWAKIHPEEIPCARSFKSLLSR